VTLLMSTAQKTKSISVMRFSGSLRESEVRVRPNSLGSGLWRCPADDTMEA
jgi:hypothetical protein